MFSPEIHPDRTVTFRVRAPNATNVSVSGEGIGRATQMERDERGVWSATIGPLEPNLYSYSFVLDGFRILDPANPVVKPELLPSTSVLYVPGDKPLIIDFDPSVPHGTVRLHEYESKSLGKLRGLRVYTPPGYDQNSRAKYPVLYLLHGAGDNQDTWTEFGHAHFILDNLIARGKARPMIVVMPDGHASFAQPQNTSTNAAGRNMAAFERDFTEDIMPFVEKNYRVRPGRENHAIVGLSMGGGQSLTIGLNHLDLFAWVGGMSSSVPNQETFAGLLKDPKVTNKKLMLLWFACGQSDGLLARNKQLDGTLTEHGVRHTFVTTDGAHEWRVWRGNLEAFAPLIFTGK